MVYNISIKIIERVRHMEKKITIFILVGIIVLIAIGVRIIFVCNGSVLKNVLYESKNIIIQQTQKGNRNLIILGSGYSLSIDEQNKIVNHDPLMILPNIEFQEETILSIFYPFESRGLEEAGKELSLFINSVMQDYDNITLIGHSKCGVCFANAAKWIKCKNVNIVTISAPFHGTTMADKEEMFKKLNWFEERIYLLIFSNHNVDKDIIPNSNFLQNADYSGLENYTHINIVSECPEKSSNPLDVVLKYLDKRGEINGDGIVSKTSQQSLSYSNTMEKDIKATHATSLELGTEILKELSIFKAGDS